MDFWLLNACRQIGLRRVLAWGLVTACGVAFCAYNSRYIRNFLNGPFQVSEADLAEVMDPESAPHYFVHVSGRRSVGTGIQEITIEKRNDEEVSRRATGVYYALSVDEHWLIVKSESGMPTEVEGSLETLPSDLHEEIFSTAEGQPPALPDDRPTGPGILVSQFYPFYVDATGFRYLGYYGIAIGLTYLLVLFYYIRKPGRWLRNPATHPVMQRVQSWGEPMIVSGEIERDLEHHANLKHGTFTFGDKYLVERAFFRFNVYRFEDLLWVYKHVTQKRLYYVIPQENTITQSWSSMEAALKSR